MHEVFINYRTGDGDEAAFAIERELSRRFGDNAVFRASKSIPPGGNFPEELLRAVQNCSVLLAVIGPDWHTDPRLGDDRDWVRREILEAYAGATMVIPVLKGRTTERLRADLLPPELRRLADAQSLRLDVRDGESGLARIAEVVANAVPALREAATSGSTGNDTVRNTSSDVSGTVVQARDVSGAVGNSGPVIRDVHGPVHAGSGDMNNYSHTFSGDGATYVQGDHHGDISHRFGGKSDDGAER
ncbi:toll/interleukin-1 receptor domain-containing protein [Actinomadura violacea]|uniref:Toll/interleukin-1 receptor domain-containing protein n=1 Tax=Actinomadura violacea TaxID=2819934 RepID=A0ABS3RMG8_9ACTN|nr:toll/interleukin-1 receptor domain-containing protein [Actinomadura violacea]MBO2457269.1 toll/interleukin-1 receptor domain-containing protein [Actinomadura violacea]